VLERALDWFDPGDAQSIGVTCCNLHGMLPRGGDLEGSVVWRRKMEAVRPAKWREKTVFLLIARTEAELAKGQFASCRKLLEQAKRAVSELSEDSWNHADYLVKLEENYVAQAGQALKHSRAPTPPVNAHEIMMTDDY